MGVGARRRHRAAPSRRGDACDSWNRWDEDVDLVADLGLGTYRFSLEWSRIEPEEGEWSTAAVDHYRRQCEALRDAGHRADRHLPPLHHPPLGGRPGRLGGSRRPPTASPRSASAWPASSATSIGRACTINEPNIVATVGLAPRLLPARARPTRDLRLRVNDVFVDAHRKAVDAIRAAAPGVPVGLTLSMTEYVAVEGGEERTRPHAATTMEDVFLDATEGDDFLGVQTYSRMRIGPDGIARPRGGRAGAGHGLRVLARSASRPPSAGRGTAPAAGCRCWSPRTASAPTTTPSASRYVHAALEGVLRCLADGIDVRGYTYWTLLDNFEWAFGYRPRFGLVGGRPHHASPRTPKPSAAWLAAVARANALVAPPG